MRKTAVLEKDIERALVRMVKQRGGLCLKWSCPGLRGVPDRIILLPGGKVIFAELKRPEGGRLSALQSVFARRLAAMGHTWLLISRQEDITALEACLDQQEQEGAGCV